MGRLVRAAIAAAVIGGVLVTSAGAAFAQTHHHGSGVDEAGIDPVTIGSVVAAALVFAWLAVRFRRTWLQPGTPDRTPARPATQPVEDTAPGAPHP